MEIMCYRCAGTGKVVWVGVRADTLNLLQRQDLELSAKQLAHLAGVKPSTMASRLAGLWRMGLVLRRRSEKGEFWRCTRI